MDYSKATRSELLNEVIRLAGIVEGQSHVAEAIRVKDKELSGLRTELLEKSQKSAQYDQVKPELDSIKEQLAVANSKITELSKPTKTVSEDVLKQMAERYERQIAFWKQGVRAYQQAHAAFLQMLQGGTITAVEYNAALLGAYNTETKREG